jgi:hypothetical protein
MLGQNDGNPLSLRPLVLERMNMIFRDEIDDERRTANAIFHLLQGPALRQPRTFADGAALSMRLRPDGVTNVERTKTRILVVRSRFELVLVSIEHAVCSCLRVSSVVACLSSRVPTMGKRRSSLHGDETTRCIALQHIYVFSRHQTHMTLVGSEVKWPAVQLL